MPLWASILIGIAVVLAIGVVILYFVGSKMQTRQLEQEQLMDQMAQTVSMLVIDKKILRMKESGLPPAVYLHPRGQERPRQDDPGPREEERLFLPFP